MKIWGCRALRRSKMTKIHILESLSNLLNSVISFVMTSKVPTRIFQFFFITFYFK